MKLFAAIKLPPHLCDQISSIQRGVSGARWSAPEKLHITLAFFGEVDDDHAEVLDMELARNTFSSFKLELKGAGHFGSLEPHALWLGVDESEPLNKLHHYCKKAARRAGIALEKRNYLPHVTLAYLARTTPLDRVVNFERRRAGFNCKPFLVDEFFLFSSHRKMKGANLYRVEASYPLLG